MSFTRPPAGDCSLDEELARPRHRRAFLKHTGAAVALVGFAAACDKDTIAPVDDDDGGGNGGGGTTPPGVTINLGTDTGVLNFAYALEQLEAAFYTQVAMAFFANSTADERSVLIDLRDHEVAHREFYEAKLGNAAIGDLTPDFSMVDFTSRQSVLQTAQTFEDLGVAAYNGAGKYISSADFLTVAGKIVSVEARHASVIRTLLGNNFAPKAFDDAMEPAAVLSAADPFIQNQITLQGP